MEYTANPLRYDEMTYRRCGRSGLQLPAISLGLWHNFGGVDTLENARSMLRLAFDRGITHFDLANNYGPPPGSAEAQFGQLLKQDFARHRDELIVSTKAGYLMWPGPYGEWGSKKYLVSSLDQSLRRMGLDYVDIFYSHRPDPDTPLEETMGALDLLYRQGKTLYVGISNYSASQTAQAVEILKRLGTPCLIHQPKYSMFERWAENGLLDVLEQEGVGCIPFSPLAQGLLTDKYLKGIPKDSRAAVPHGFLQESAITAETVQKITSLHVIAGQRGQTLAQMAISWLLKDPRVTSVLIGASRPAQIIDCLGSLNNTTFGPEELAAIETVLGK
jgi:L-glyceraldehyde 3-phosphate reductase